MLLSRLYYLTNRIKFRMHTIDGFSHKKSVDIKELGITSHLFKHDKSGADFLHIASDDSNNACCITIRTFAANNKGVPHVLEHIALCGSKKYPVRDPFFKMLSRSQQTFMNAFTSDNTTCYIYSTQNATDFKNLFDMYFESVFNPLLSESSYWQEGFRLENSDKDDINSQIEAKGVVFNEMKGVFSSMGSFYESNLCRELMPSNVYKWTSGGIPIDIMDLKHEDLTSFHKKFYRPSNSIIVTYGNIPLETQARMVNEKLISMNKEDINYYVNNVDKWDIPRKITVFAAPDPLAVDQTKTTALSMNYLLADNSNVYLNFCFDVLSMLLINGPCSSFYQSLISPQIGSDYSWNSGFSNYTKDSYFSVGLQGIAESDTEKVESIIQETFRKVAIEGFSQERIDSVINSLELSVKNRTKNFGINLLNSLNTPWSLGSDFVEYFRINNLIRKFKEDLNSNPNFLTDLVKTHFLTNPHVLTMTLKVDENFPAREKKAEHDKLELLVNNCCRENVYEIGKKLEKEASKPEDLSVLPCLSLGDIDKSVTRQDISIASMDGVDSYYCNTTTNELVYFKMMLGCNHLTQEEIRYLPILCDVMTQMGTTKMDYKEQDLKIISVSSGFNVSSVINVCPFTSDNAHLSILLGNHCLVSNFEKCLDFWSEIINELTLDDYDRLGVIIKTNATEMADSITYSGHHYAKLCASSLIHPASHKTELIKGLSLVSLLKSLSDQTDKQQISEKLRQIAKKVFNRNDCRTLITTSEDMKDNCLYKVDSFLRSLPLIIESPKPDYFQDIDWTQTNSSNKVHYELPFNVSYAAKAIQVPIGFTDRDHATLEIISELLSWKFLHVEIREKGGAYGGGSAFKAPIFSFYSYRDPNQLETFNIYEKAIEWVLNDNSFTQQDIDEAKLLVFQKLDSPVPPKSMGVKLFMEEIDDDMLQKHREFVFETTRDDIINCVNKYLKNPLNVGMCLIGPHNEQISNDKSWSTLKF